MHTTNTSEYAQFNQLALGKLSIMRLSGSVVVGGIITFFLFVAMHSLINQENKTPIVEGPIVQVSSVLDIPEEKIIVRPKPKPLPEIKQKPITPTEIPKTPSNKTNFTNIIQIPAISSEKLIVELAAVDQQPRPIVRVDPRYPVPALSAGTEGFVSLSFGVSASGEVVNIKITDSHPRNTFDRSAKQALRKWRYQPKMVSGSPVGMEGLAVRLDFTLPKT